MKAKELESILAKIEDIVCEGEEIDKLKSIMRRCNLPRRVKERIFFATKCLIYHYKDNKNGIFIVVSGIDKSGKETHAFNTKRIKGIKSISQYLKEKSFNVLSVSLPSYQTTLGSLVESYLGKDKVKFEGKISPNLAWILWSLDRAQHTKVIGNWLSKGKNYVVISKRWTESNVVYQSIQGVDTKRIIKLERNLVKQDVTLILDISPEVALLRGKEFDVYEERKNLEKVRRLYLQLPKIYPYGDFYLIDSSRSLEDVNKDVIIAIKDIVKGK